MLEYFQHSNEFVAFGRTQSFQSHLVVLTLLPLHSLKELSSLVGQEYSPCASIGRVWLPRNKTACLQPVEDVAEACFTYVKNSGQFRLHHAVVSGKMRDYPPLCSGDLQGLHDSIECASTHARDVMDQEAQPQIALAVFVNMCEIRVQHAALRWSVQHYLLSPRCIRDFLALRPFQFQPAEKYHFG